MSGGDGGLDELEGPKTPVHLLAPQCKVAALLVFALSVALTPRETFWPYALHLLVLAAVAAVAKVGPGYLARRLVVEVPFVLFVVALPFLAIGPTVSVLGLDLAVAGLWTAWAIVAKATLVLLATAIVAAATPPAEMLVGLERLKAPRIMTAIAGFTIRYLDVVVQELRRMQVARVARGDDPRFLWQARAVLRSTGSLVARSFERGERVHLAMISRGFDGTMPAALATERPAALAWVGALVPAAAAAAIAVGAGLAG